MQYLSFKDFMLLEKIIPHEVSYGNNLSNKKWFSITDKKVIFKKTIVEDYLHFTFFQCNDTFYQVYITGGENHRSEIRFSSSKNFDVDVMNSKDMFKIGKYIDDNFTLQRTNERLAQTVFNMFFYVVLQGLKSFRIKKFQFQAPENSVLDKFYNKIFNNTNIIKHLEEYNIFYSGKHDSFFSFETKKSR